MSRLFLKIVFGIICFIPLVSYGNYTVTPVKLNIAPGSTMASLTVQNNNDSARHFQLSIFQTDKNGKNIGEAETQDLVVAPAMFKVKSKKGQVIRVMVKNPTTAAENKYYVISVKELPHGKVENNSVKVIAEFRVPVFVGKEEKDEAAAQPAEKANE